MLDSLQANTRRLAQSMIATKYRTGRRGRRTKPALHRDVVEEMSAEPHLEEVFGRSRWRYLDGSPRVPQIGTGRLHTMTPGSRR